MEEDIIFGKNRHLFGGLEPSNVRHFTAYTVGDNVCLHVELPKDTVIDGQTLVTVAGATIRRSTTDYPKDEFDGEFVMDVTEDGVYVDTENKMDRNCYYYSVFPYSDQGVYNRSDKNRTIYIPNSYIFGYDLDQADGDPDTRVSYPDDVQNAEYKSAYMDFTAGIFNYGDWPSKAGEKFMPRPCMIASNGTVQCYLNPDDYTLCDDGVTPSGISTSGLNVMVEWPKIYTKRWEENGIYHFRCSDVKIDDTWDCWCNYDKNDNEIDHFYTSVYPAALQTTSTTLGYRLKSTTGLSAVIALYGYLRPGAIEIGDGWDIDMACDRLLINDLLTMIGKSTDSQSIFGYGSPGTNGDMNSKGMFWGQSATSGSVKIFGMERLWCCRARLVWGLWIKNGYYNLKITKGSHDGINDLPIGYAPGSEGWCISVVCTPYGLIPSFGTGSSTTYFCDYGGGFGYNQYTLFSVGFGAGFSKIGAYYDGAYALTQTYDSTWDNTSDTSYNCITGLSFKPTKS